MSRKKMALWVFLALAVVAAIFGFKIHAELARGVQIFWLAELWPPAAVLSIGLVTCLEFLAPSPSAPAESPKRTQRPKNKGRAKA